MDLIFWNALFSIYQYQSIKFTLIPKGQTDPTGPNRFWVVSYEFTLFLKF